METKSLLFGLMGFFLGGLIVSVAATTFDKSNTEKEDAMSMSRITDSLKDKRGDEFDRVFIAEMIVHHEGAIEMAKLAGKNAKHDEIKKLSNDILTAQEEEISEMKQWQKEWGYHSAVDHSKMGYK